MLNHDDETVSPNVQHPGMGIALGRSSMVPSTSPQSQGYTLAELIVVLAIVGFLAAFGAPFLAKISQRNNLKSAVREIQSTLMAARMTAVKRNAPVSVAIVSLTPPITLQVIEPQPPAPTPTNPPKFIVLPALAVRFVETPNTTNGAVAFGGDGRLITTPPLPATTPALRMIVEGPVERLRPQPDQDRHDPGRGSADRHPGGLAMSARLCLCPSRRREAGVTLVELIIATFLLALILLAIAPLFITSVKSNYAANEYTSIHNIARDRLEQLMSLPFNDPKLDAAGSPFANDLSPHLPDPATGLPSASSPLNTLTVTYEVQLFQESPPATGAKWIFLPHIAGSPWDFKRVDVTVTSRSFNTLSGLGIGARTAKVSGFIRNPSPGTP